MWSLDGNHKALLVLVGAAIRVVRLSGACLVVVPDWQILEVFVRYVGVRSIIGVREHILLLLFQLID